MISPLPTPSHAILRGTEESGVSLHLPLPVKCTLPVLDIYQARLERSEPSSVTVNRFGSCSCTILEYVNGASDDLLFWSLYVPAATSCW